MNKIHQTISKAYNNTQQQGSRLLFLFFSVKEQVHFTILSRKFHVFQLQDRNTDKPQDFVRFLQKIILLWCFMEDVTPNQNSQMFIH